jgi:hypothetical protein
MFRNKKNIHLSLMLYIYFLFTIDTTAAVKKKTFDFVVGVDGNFKAAMTAAAKSASSGNRYLLFFPNGQYDIGKLTGDANEVTTFPTSNVSFIGKMQTVPSFLIKQSMKGSVLLPHCFLKMQTICISRTSQY